MAKVLSIPSKAVEFENDAHKVWFVYNTVSRRIILSSVRHLLYQDADMWMERYLTSKYKCTQNIDWDWGKDVDYERIQAVRDLHDT